MIGSKNSCMNDGTRAFPLERWAEAMIGVTQCVCQWLIGAEQQPVRQAFHYHAEQDTEPTGRCEETLAGFLFCVTTLNPPESGRGRRGQCCGE